MSSRRLLLAVCVVAVLGCLAYVPALGLPFISDDYAHIEVARIYAPPSGWAALLADPLYRARTTSHFLTYWTEQTFGLTPVWFNLSSLLLHLLNACLLLGLALHPAIGWRVAIPAAIFFVLRCRHQEAVIWYSALPELLVFTFLLLGLYFYLAWTQRGGRGWYAAALAGAALALLSKESGVMFAPLAALLLWYAGDRVRAHWLGLLPAAALAGLYTLWTFSAHASHQFFSDGTFALQGGFLRVEMNSLIRSLWIWGTLALLVLLFQRSREARRTVVFGLAWMILALLPYAFLTYMNTVPSRHTYLAHAGMAVMAGTAFAAVAGRLPRRALALIVAAYVVHQAGYLWIAKLPQFKERASYTESLLRAFETAGQPEDVLLPPDWPYNDEVALAAIRVVHGKKVVVHRPPRPDAGGQGVLAQ